MDNDEVKVVRNILSETGANKESAISILADIQLKYNYLPERMLKYVAENSDITMPDIMGIATFYSMFRLTPAGKHKISVCAGTACYIKGADLIFDAFKQYLEIEKEEDTDGKKMFTVEKIACLGCCALAPAVRIDNEIFGFVRGENIPFIIDDFLSKTELKQEFEDYSNKENGGDVSYINICLCSGCLASGAADIWVALEKIIIENNLPAVLKKVGCTGVSHLAPIVEIIDPHGNIKRYSRPGVNDLKEIILENTPRGAAFRRVRHKISSFFNAAFLVSVNDEKKSKEITDWDERVFLKKQQHIATNHFGKIAPLDFTEYKKNGGWSALEKCLHDYSPEQIIEILKKSELRGRGGAGFPTGRKIEIVHSSGGGRKYIICNGDEGDPGAFMDRMLLESYPFRIIEGMLIASFAAGIHRGYLYIRDEYPEALNRVRRAIDICRAENMLGDNILNAGFSLDLKVVRGAGAFVCGEETALISAIEGKRGGPRVKPPFPAESGLRGRPTLVSNVETLSMIPWIMTNGSRKFSEIGSESSRGTKTFALAGKIKNQGLIEVPMGTTLREIIDDIGGGGENNNKIKAVQTGGPSGGCVPYHLTDISVDYEALISAGSFMGSGGLIVLDETDCMVDIAKYFLTFSQNESCGKCTFCRIGAKSMLDILERIVNGDGKEGDIEEIEELGHVIKAGSMCGLGKSAPNPVLSTIRHYRNEYEDHIDGICTVKKCTALMQYEIDADCIGCAICSRVCAAGAIEFTPYEKHEIDQIKCVKCGACFNACPEGAVKREDKVKRNSK